MGIMRFGAYKPDTTRRIF